MHSDKITEGVLKYETHGKSFHQIMNSARKMKTFLQTLYLFYFEKSQYLGNETDQ